jgi:hypothetical protein
MNNTNYLINIMEDQIAFNKNKSLFFEGRTIFETSNEMNDLLMYHFDKVQNLFAKDNIELNKLILASSEKTMEVFQNSNQYISFRDKDKIILQRLYKNILIKLKTNYLNTGSLNEKVISECFSEHYRNLKEFLKITNGNNLFESYKLSETIPYVVCEEYSAELQIKILGLDIKNLEEPIIDIGCGKEFRLVKLLREKGYEAYGLDRINSKEDFIIKSNWMDYNFEPTKWGTIVSHMAFSNHFNHHHLREDGQYVEFMKKYLEILKSLKVKGILAYAPKIEVVEEIVKNHYKGVYKLEKKGLSINITRFK